MSEEKTVKISFSKTSEVETCRIKHLLWAGDEEIEIPNWKYYRRRNPSEKPEDFVPILFKENEFSEIVLGSYRAEAALGEGRFEDYKDNWWKTNEIEYWAYAYLPPEQEKDIQ